MTGNAIAKKIFDGAFRIHTTLGRDSRKDAKPAKVKPAAARRIAALQILSAVDPKAETTS